MDETANNFFAKLTHKGWMMLFLFICMMSQGFLFVLLLDKNFFLDVDLWKLIFLSSSVGVPLFCIYSILLYMIITNVGERANLQIKQEDEINLAAVGGLVLTNILVGVSLMFFYWFKNLNGIIIFNLFLIFFIFLSRKKYEKEILSEGNK